MNEKITLSVLQAAIDCGVMDFVVCPAGRNAPFVDILRSEERLNTHYWPEERSAAFFALGLSRRKQQPVAIIVTSGTAAGELLPAAMEAYYSKVPLLLITADRPLRFRGSGAPQTAEQVGLFGPYTPFCVDIHGEGESNLAQWDQQAPAHLNVCLEEPQGQPAYSGKTLKMVSPQIRNSNYDFNQSSQKLNSFLSNIRYPLIVVSTIPWHVRDQVADFILKLKAPVYLEGISGLREDPRLQNLRIKNTENILEFAHHGRYPIDGVLRIGGIPTNRLWRDIENLEGSIQVCSLSELPFSGLSWNTNVAFVDMEDFLKHYHPICTFQPEKAAEWLKNDDDFTLKLQELFQEEPLSEPALMRAIANTISGGSHVYLGNSLPIREWDLAAGSQDRGLQVTASRGLNGIDGQIATFLGLCDHKRDNWAILGDLTALYDMAGLWGLPFAASSNISIVIVNNGGGKIFERMFPHVEMLNQHRLSFEPLAEMWGLKYQCIKNGIDVLASGNNNLIEIIPDDSSTKRFWNKFGAIKHEFMNISCQKFSGVQV